MYSSVARGGGSGVASELLLEQRVCRILTVMLGGELEDATRV